MVPRCQGWVVAERDLDARVDGELGVLGHLLAVVPGQRAAQLLGWLEDRGVRAGRIPSAVHPSGRGTSST